MKYRHTYEQAAKLFNDCFDECYGAVKFGMLSYQPADVLASVDPVAYRQEVLNWADHEGIEIVEDDE